MSEASRSVVAAASASLNAGLPQVARVPERRSSYAQRNEARLFALKIVRDKAYRDALLKAARERTLAPAVEVTLLAYAYGKPTERVELGRPGAFSDLDSLSVPELAARARALVAVASGLSAEVEDDVDDVRSRSAEPLAQSATDSASAEAERVRLLRSAQREAERKRMNATDSSEDLRGDSLRDGLDEDARSV